MLNKAESKKESKIGYKPITFNQQQLQTLIPKVQSEINRILLIPQISSSDKLKLNYYDEFIKDLQVTKPSKSLWVKDEIFVYLLDILSNKIPIEKDLKEIINLYLMK